MKKRILCAMLAAVMTLSLVACGGSESKTEEAPAATESQPVEEEAEKVDPANAPTLVWILPGTEQADHDKVMDAVNAITVEEIGVKIDMQYFDWSAYSERLNLNMAGGTEFDLCWLDASSIVSGAKMGGLVDLTEELTKVPVLEEQISDYAWDAVTVDGGIYGVPNEQIFATGGALAIRTDLVEKYGLDVNSIETVLDIEPFLEQVKQGEPDLFPFRATEVQNYFTNKYDYDPGSGVRLALDGTNKAYYNMDTPEFKEHVLKIREWYEKGYIRQDSATVTSDTAEYLAGKYAVYRTGQKPGVEAEEEAKLGIDLTIVPVGPTLITTRSITATTTGVSATSKHVEEAVKFLELVNTNAEVYNLICYGIEGTHYETLENGHIKQVENSGYAPNSSWEFGYQYNALLLENQADDTWEETKRFNQEAVKSIYLGFTVDTDPIKTEIAQCKAIYNEYNPIMYMGTEEVDAYWDTMVSRLKDAGMDKVVEEVQRQVDEYLAGK